MAEQTKEQEKKQFRYIVRVASRDLDGNRPIYMALTNIKGIGHRASLIFARAFERETGIPFDERIGKLNEEHVKLLESIIKDPLRYGVPEWVLNRRKDFYTGKAMHAIMGDLEFTTREDIKRLNRIKSYRGLRLAWGLPVRGQRTKSTHRGKGPIVGVQKKEARPGTKKKSSSSKSK
ncbi:MAG: 30S ribosomal protein S13 [Candidatus Iainarchaeum archaeon]|uniref:Small ribosomal subunit protein uS13 n=1 Tax=Candidatus Iainarchaeum sp. TaxID=3101447 RepID=A0A497JGK1_9ARCH|nr:MAG: 30S ribosomal protein S13 [Candidatus Diapherotrites archaeon]